MNSAAKTTQIILGGTFDPIHFGHLRMAQEMLNLFPEANIHLMPSAYPPHRAEPSASPRQRLEMLRLVLDPIENLKIDDRELARHEPSYSVVTLQQIRKEIADSSLIFLMGTDAFAKLDQWYQWHKLLDLTNILVVGRPNSQLPESGELARIYQEKLVEQVTDLSRYANGKIGYLQMPQLDISSTYIREQIKCGKSPRFLVPSVILDYIESHHLYRES